MEKWFKTTDMDDDDSTWRSFSRIDVIAKNYMICLLF